MLKNYITTIFRQIRKNKIFSFINILGLALGMGACLVITQYVNFHTSFDKYHSNSDKLFRLEAESFKSGESLGMGLQTPAMLTETLKDQSPHVINVARFYSYNYANSTLIHKTEEKLISFEQNGIYGTDKGTFDLFDIDFVAGSVDKFDEPQKAIITLSASRKYFESPEDAIGKQFSLSGNNGSVDYELIGIIEDLPNNSHLDFELLISFPSLLNYTKSGQSWTSASFISYMLLSDVEKQDEVLAETDRLFEKNAREIYAQSGYDLKFSLRPLEEIHLNPISSEDFTTGVDQNIIMSLSLIAIVILVIAWINYMNLSLVRTMRRLKEVGIRKCMGSTLKQITMLFVMEAFIMNLIAFIIAIISIQVFEGYLIDVTGLPVSALMNLEVLLVLGGLAITGTLIVGFYPYALLKTLNIVNVLVGKNNAATGTKMRKSLVFVQFLITFMLIAGTLTIYNQITYMRDADLGINIDNVLVLQSPPANVGSEDRSDLARFSTLKTELLKQTKITAITSAGEIPGEQVGWGAGLFLKNKSRENMVSSGLISMDLNFPEFFGIDVIAGRELRKGDDPWSKGDVVINAKLAEQLGFSNPDDALGAEIDGFYGPTLTVRGVVENHHHTSLHDDYTPIAYILSSWAEFYFVRFGLDENSNESLNDQLAGLMSTIEGEWSQVYNDYQMNYFFLDTAFDEQYKEDIRFGKIFSGFSSLAIIIACLGLFGLTTFTIQQRTKEIGIRKVLGASLHNLIGLLSKEYIILVGIACIVSLPLAWWFMSQWLTNYTFRIELGWWFYVIPVIMVLSLALLSILSKIMTTVKKNPVESLRYE